MTYNVFGGTLNLTQPSMWPHFDASVFCVDCNLLCLIPSSDNGIQVLMCGPLFLVKVPPTSKQRNVEPVG